MDTYHELIENIRESRKRMSKECNHDPETYIKYLKSFNIKYAKQVDAFEKLGGGLSVRAVDEQTTSIE